MVEVEEKSEKEGEWRKGGVEEEEEKQEVQELAKERV